MIINYVEFKEMPEEKQKEYLTKWREKHPTKEIINGMGINSNTFYRLLKKFDIPKRDMKPRNEKPEKNEVTHIESIKNTKKEESKSTGMTIQVDGTYSAKELTNTFEKLGIVIDNDKAKYEVKLQVNEV